MRGLLMRQHTLGDDMPEGEDSATPSQASPTEHLREQLQAESNGTKANQSDTSAADKTRQNGSYHQPTDSSVTTEIDASAKQLRDANQWQMQELLNNQQLKKKQMQGEKQKNDRAARARLREEREAARKAVGPSSEDESDQSEEEKDYLPRRGSKGGILGRPRGRKTGTGGPRGRPRKRPIEETGSDTPPQSGALRVQSSPRIENGVEIFPFPTPKDGLKLSVYFQ